VRLIAVRLIALLAVLLASVAIVSTSRTFSGTVDEPAHIAAGMQWLSTGAYDYDLQHPPIGRIAAALGPFIHGARSTGAPGVFDEGANILGAGDHYVNTLASARHGELVFFLLLAAVVWSWSRRLTNDAGAAIATVLLATNPTILAHAGLATTDIACAAMTTVALFAAVWWSEKPTWRRAVVVGAAIGLAIASRLSGIAFVGGSLVTCYLLRRAMTGRWSFAGIESARSTGAMLAGAIGACMVVIWAAYRFTFGPLHPGGISVPAPAFVAGVTTFLLHGRTGHPTFLLGTPGLHGWWYYFPIALLVKTPLPLLLGCVLGTVAAARCIRERTDWTSTIPLCAAVTVLVISTSVHVDLGVRLILPIYPLLAIVAAQGILSLWAQSRTRTSAAVIGLLMASAVVVEARTYPDNLSYFNLLAGDHPEHVLVDSNLDWGQDLYRLRDTIRARGISDTVRIAYFGTADVSAAGVPNARQLGLHEHTTGWIAASETYLAGEWVGRAYQWLLDYPPTARIGPSMRLWYIPPSAATRDSLRR
jgi:hypothetical protein